tara:strand:- start:2688 stop:3620 length:933 start_codon:yes stop_codon:yes gene_type:complete
MSISRFNSIRLTTSNVDGQKILLEEVGGKLAVNSSEVITKGSDSIILSNLPTTDPETDNQLWNDNGTLKISSASGFSNVFSASFDQDKLETTYTFTSTTTFSTSVWLKAPSENGNAHFVSNSDAGGSEMRVVLGVKNGNYQIYIGSGQWKTDSVSASALLDGDWHNLILTIDGTNTNGVNLYLDGNTTPVVTATSTQSITAGTAPLFFGTGWASFYDYLGFMDEVAIWETVLSTSDVSDIGGGGAPTDLTSYSPVGWWRFGDGTGDTNSSSASPANGDTVGTIVDQGSGGNDATQTTASLRPTFSTDVPT